MVAQYDIAIVGYGPVGQTLATLLGHKGWSVAVFDKQKSLYPLPRACHLDHEAMRILQSMGITAEISNELVPAREYLFLRPDLSVISDLPRDWETPSGWEASYHFYQPDIENIFDGAAKEAPGVSVFQGVEVTDVEVADDSVILVLDGTQRVEAKYVVGADGANSVVRSRSDIDYEDLGFESTWVVCDVQVKEGQDLPKVPDTGQVLDPAQPGHMAWLGKRYYRWEFMIVDDRDPDEAAEPENVWPKISRWVTPETSVLKRSTAYTFRSQVATVFNKGRVLLAGDAAHLMPPFMGQGMVSGLRDAATLTWILDLVLRGIAPEEFLDNYTLIRRPHVIDYINESVRVGRMVCETDHEKAAARDAALEAKTESDPPFQPATGGFYLLGPLAGQLGVQPSVFHNGNQILLDDLIGARWTLLTATGSDVLGHNAEMEKASEKLKLVRVLLDDGTDTDTLPSDVRNYTPISSAVKDWLTNAGVTWAIVRPDAYVYATGSGNKDASEVIIELTRSIQAGETRVISSATA